VDLTRASSYFKMAADQGYAQGQSECARCLMNGWSVVVDLPRAAPYFKMAADQGNAEAQLACGLCFALIEG
jgi:TPR repeat protein